MLLIPLQVDVLVTRNLTTMNVHVRRLSSLADVFFERSLHSAVSPLNAHR
jgi:hypothetical protein